MPWLINATQLDKFKKYQKNVVVLDSTWCIPEENRNPKEEYIARHIAGARFFDIDSLSDANTDLPHMLTLDENIINEKIGALGISNDSRIILYDGSKQHTSCRALWMFKMFGHSPNQLYILDGGMDAWEKYSGKFDEGMPHITAKKYKATVQPKFLRTLQQMKANVHQPQEQVVDLRHAVRYAGGAEPRPGKRPGHLPGSFCFPYMTMFDELGYWKPLEKIRKQLVGIGLDINTPVVTTCGSGMTAPILNFVLDLANHPQHAVYDGSWSEWGADTLYSGESSLEERPVITSTE